MKKIIIVALVVIVGFFVVGMAKDQIIKSVVMAVGSNVTGTRIQIGGFSLGILKQVVSIKNFKMYNPAGFPAGVMVDLPQVHVESELFSLLKGKLHLKTVSIELKELNLIKNKEGKLNVDSLKVSQQQPEEAREKKPAKPQQMQIDLLNLNIGRIVMRDYSVEKGPAVEVYDINLKKSYKNITGAQQLTALILTEPMKAAGIKGAAIYGVSALAGVAVLPVAATVMFMGKDSAEKDFDVSLDKLYNVSLKLLNSIGQVKKEDKASGVIQADVRGANITVKLKELSGRTNQIVISARKYMLPKPEIAGGILYQITEELK